MRTLFQEELDKFLDQLSLLGNSTHEALHKAVKSFDERDLDLAHEVITNDLHINAMTLEIEQSAYRLIALQQPVAGDLRRIFAILMASSDFERLADHAVSIAKAVMRRSPDSPSIEKADEIILQMTEIVSSMLSDAIEAFVTKDDKKAMEVARRDVEVDTLLKRIYTEVPGFIEQNKEVVTAGIGYIGIASSLERMGDYVTNICERIVYVHTGEVIELN